MVTASHRFRDEVKLYKVIESCRTFDQCASALRYIKAYEEQYNTYMCSARNTLNTREFVISNSKMMEGIDEA